MNRHFLPILLIIIVSLALYANTLQNGFVYDDDDTIVNNGLIKDFNNLSKLFNSNYFVLSGEGSYRPVVTLTYFIDYALYRLNARGFHLTNVLLHAANGLLLYIFLFLINQGSKGLLPLLNKPLMITLLFITNPILTEAINAVSFREELLVFFFYIAAFNIYLFMRSTVLTYRSYLFYAISCVLYFMALFSKEMAVTLPLSIWCYEWLYAKDEKAGKGSFFLNLYNIGYIAITFIYLFFRFYYFSNPTEITLPNWGFIQRIISIPILIISCLKLCLFPISLSADYDFVPLKSIFSYSFIFSASAVSFMMALIVSTKLSKKKEISFATLFFVIALTPVYNIIPISNPLAERYLYLPALGISILSGSIIFLLFDAQNKNRNYCVILLLLSIFCLFSYSVIKRNTIWKNGFTLWSDTVKKMPNSAQAHYNLGFAYNKQWLLDDAIQEYNKALSLSPNASMIYCDLAIVYIKQGKIDMAVRQLIAALRLDPNNPTIHNDLANMYIEQGKFKEAIEEYKYAVMLRPYSANYHYNLAKAFHRQGQYIDAVYEYKAALILKPDHFDARRNLDAILKRGIKN